MPTSTLSIVAHQDDDILFMFPDIPSDIQAGYRTTICYLTAGNLLDGPAGQPYARQRLTGVWAAYARAARAGQGGAIPANAWDHEVLSLRGRDVDAYRLANRTVELVFLDLDAAAGADPGALKQLWQVPGFVANPIDGKPGYARDQLVDVLRGLVDYCAADYVRTGDTWGQDTADHVDHIAGAHFAGEALSPGGITSKPRYEYLGYHLRNLPPNLGGYWVTEKTACWQAYRTHDPELGPGAWDELMTRQQLRQYYPVGAPWVPRVGW